MCSKLVIENDDDLPFISINHISKHGGLSKVYYKFIGFKNKILLQFSWRRGLKDSRDPGFKGLFSKDFISFFNILSISAISFLSIPNLPFSIKSKSSISLNKLRMTFARFSTNCNSLAIHSNP